MQYRQWSGIYHAPDERSAADEEEDEQDAPSNPDYLVIDGQKVPTDVILGDHRNKSEWQKKNTEEAQRIAAERRELNELANNLVNRIPGNKGDNAPKAEDAGVDLKKAVEALPDQVEDPEGFKRGLAELMDAHSQRAVKAAQAAVEAAQQSTHRRISDESTTSRIQAENRQLIDRTLEREFDDISAAEKTELLEELEGLRGKRYGEYVQLGDGSRIFRFNEAAIKRAARGVDSLYQREVNGKTAAARTEGLRGRARGQQADTGSRSRGAPAKPGPNASIADKIDWLRTQSEAQQEQYVETMSAKDRDAMISALYDEDLAA